MIDGVALARSTVSRCSSSLRTFISRPTRSRCFLEAFEGPLDLLLYLIRKQNFNVLDIRWRA